MAESAKLLINIWTEDDKTLPSEGSDLAELMVPHLEHVGNLCAQGYLCGQILDDQFQGWWSLEKG